MYVAEQQLTSEEIIESLQETATLVDKLRERDILERRLREVRDLEERLQEVDEMAERLQEVIEEELGKEEVDQLREEEGDLEREVRIQAESTTETVLKKSAQRIETKEDEVDELEDQIKQVFLKGLLPEEEEVEVKQVSEKEVKDRSLLDDDLREKQCEIEKEWKNEVEEESGSSDVAGSTSVAAYQKVERRTQKRVTIVEERGLGCEEMADVQLQAVVMSEERLVKEGTWRQDITERGVTDRLQPEDPSQVAEKDVWFILFDCPPYKAVFMPPGKVFQLETSLIL